MVEEKQDIIERPPVLPARVYKVKTAQCGSLYVTVCHTGGEYTPDFRLVEVFATVGGSGDCPAAFLQSMTRTVSLALRAGAPVDKLIKTLMKVRCPMPFYGNPWMGKGQTLSCVNAVAKILQLEMQLGKTSEEKSESRSDSTD